MKLCTSMRSAGLSCVNTRRRIVSQVEQAPIHIGRDLRVILDREPMADSLHEVASGCRLQEHALVGRPQERQVCGDLPGQRPVGRDRITHPSDPGIAVAIGEDGRRAEECAAMLRQNLAKPGRFLQQGSIEAVECRFGLNEPSTDGIVEDSIAYRTLCVCNDI